MIPTQRDEPYGQRTRLGWGIVGVIEKGTEEKDHGVSHRMLTQVVPNELGKGKFSFQLSHGQRRFSVLTNTQGASN